MRKLLISTLMISLLSNQAVAGISGVWSTREGCEWKSASKKDSAVPSPDNLFDLMYLTNKGIEGYEWGCNFVRSFDGEYGETVQIASCSAEGDAWPQMMITKQDGKNGWNVSILNEKNEPENVNFPIKCEE